VAFATKPELARTMIERAVKAGIPFSWVTADEVYGGNPKLRRRLDPSCAKPACPQTPPCPGGAAAPSATSSPEACAEPPAGHDDLPVGGDQVDVVLAGGTVLQNKLRSHASPFDRVPDL
jgi:hypothetical protein